MNTNRGSLLYESLFAFLLLITVVVMIVSLYSSINQSKLTISNYYQDMNMKEKSLSQKESYIDIIEMVLP